MKAYIHITLKDGVLDPQGKAIQHALSALGFDGINNVRQGKYIEVDMVGTDREKAAKSVDHMCRKLLSNTVIENYTIEIK